MGIKRKLVLVPSAYNSSAMGDIENFIKYYKDCFDVYVITKREDGEDVEELGGVKYVKRGTRFDSYIQISADYIIDAGSMTSANKFSNSQKRISVWHGIPYKKMFVDLEKRHLITATDYGKGYDLMISPSKWYTERFLRQSMLYEGEILETAISRTDSLFISDKNKKEIRKIFGIPENNKILLYAPTFRKAGHFDLPFDPKKAKEALGDEWTVLVKAHYLNTISNITDIIDATSYPSVNNLMAIADMLVTDYSSVMFDYSILGKPGILFQYDREEYENDRSFMFSMEDYVDEKYIVTNENNFYQLLSDSVSIGDNFKRIKENFYPHQKPNSTEELVSKLALDATERQIDEIIFLVNELNEIGGVHSFILDLAVHFKSRYDAKIYVLAINEFNSDKNELYFFDREGVIDVKRSFEINPGTVKSILQSTNGYIISCQYSAHMKFQPYMKGKRCILMFHGDTKDIVNKTVYSWHLDSLNNKELYNYTKLAFLTESNCELIKKELSESIRKKVISIENGVDFSDSKNLYKESGDFVFVSRLDEDKNPMEAVELFADNSINSNYKLHIYGDGTLREAMERQASESEAADRIIFHGFESDKEKIYKDKQGLISVSMTEGLPLTFLEAAKYGIPIYAYDSFTSCKDLITESSGVLIHPGDRQGFINKLNNPIDMAGYNNGNIKSMFSSESVAEKWDDIFSELGCKNEDNKTEPAKKTYKKKRKTIKKLKNAIRNSSVFAENERYAELSTMWRNIRYKKSRKDLPLVSVIMPFYNNNETIEKAIRSVEKCGYRNYEILLINDGSEQDPRDVIGERSKVRYFYKPNGGLSSTRNYGIDRASGKYVFFLDSDDITFPDGIYRLVSYAEEHNLKMVCGKTVRHRVRDGSETIWYKGAYTRTYVNNMNTRYMILDDTIATGKLYLLDMLNAKNIRFKDGLYEDILFTGELYASLNRIGVIKKLVQKWMVYGTNTSITTSASLDNSLARLKNVDEVFRKQKSELNRVFYTRQYIRHHIITCLNGFNKYDESEKRVLYDALRDGMVLRKDYAIDKYQSSSTKIDLYKALLEGDYDKFCDIAEAFTDQYEEDVKTK